MTHWRSAVADMRFLTIDDYLAELQCSGRSARRPRVDLVGLCQGGWLSLLYAALSRQGAQVGAGRRRSTSPPRPLACRRSPMPPRCRCSGTGDARRRARARPRRKFWGPKRSPTTISISCCKRARRVDSSVFTHAGGTIRAWYAWTVDLPGTYYLEVIEKLYKHNELASGRFMALGQRIDLAMLRTPLIPAGGERR